MNSHVNTLLDYSMPDTGDMAIRDVLTRLMADTGENPHSLAGKTGVPQPTIYRIAQGETPEPRRKTVERLAKFFGLSVDDMYGSPGSHAGHRAPQQPTQPIDPILGDLAALLPEDAAVWRAQIAAAAIKARREHADRRSGDGRLPIDIPKDRRAA